MFQQLKNIDTAFRHIKVFSVILILVCLLITGLVLFKSYQAIDAANNRVYILSNGKALEAFSANRKDNIKVEAKDHIATFHQYFFSLDPDDKVIQSNISKALYLADESAKNQYDNLKEEGYYTNLISANISQKISIDSIQIDLEQTPYYFRCFATQQLIRSSSTATRSLITEGYLRNVSRSDNNPHGFLIEKWKIISNQNLSKP
ncbi:conjugative transposon protein TraK [Pelobium sp.]|nr:conjugative transposon protein TraK [Pelobium sp.]MDA9554660.1 conjugative transposon protein TraK [Pelobium sp.]